MRRTARGVGHRWIGAVAGAFAVALWAGCTASDGGEGPSDRDSALDSDTDRPVPSESDATDSGDSDPHSDPGGPGWPGFVVPAFDAPIFVGGARLDVVVADAGPGLFVSFFDRDLGVVCRPDRAGDGTLRCLPDRASLVTRYLDPTCSEPVYRVADDACVTDPVLRERVEDDSVCLLEERATDWPLSPVVPSVLYTPVGSSCAEDATQDLSADWRGYSPLTDAAVDPASWVALRQQDVIGPRGLGRTYWLAEDGARAATGLADAGGLAVAWEADDGHVALPGPVLIRRDNRYFGVSTCDASPAVADPSLPSCPSARTVLRQESSTPGVPHTVASVRVDAWRSSSQGCTSVVTRGTWLVAGDPVDLEQALPMVASVRPDTGSVSAWGWEDEDGAWLGPRTAGPLRAEDGTGWRLTGRAGGAVARLALAHREIDGIVLWEDDACTEPLVTVTNDPEAVWAVQRDADGCDTPDGEAPVVRAWALGDAVQGIPFTRSAFGACVSVGLELPGLRRRATEVGLDEGVPLVGTRRIGP